MIQKVKGYITNRDNSEFILGVLVSVLTIILGLLISPLGWSTLLLLCMLIVNTVYCLTLLFIYIIWTYRLNEKKTRKDIDEKEKIIQLVSKVKSEYNCEYGISGNSLIVSANEIAKTELQGGFKEIWLVTNDLSTEIGDGDYSSAVFNNLLNTDTIYRYFIPDSKIANLRKERIIENSMINGERNNKLFFYLLNDNFFSLVPDFDFSIYIDDVGKKDGYMGYMTSQPNENSKKRFEIRMHIDFVDAIYAKLDDIKNRS